MIQSNLTRAIATLGIPMPPALQEADDVRAALQRHVHNVMAQPLDDLRTLISTVSLSPEQAVEALIAAAQTRVTRQAVLEVSGELEKSLVTADRTRVRSCAPQLMANGAEVLDVLAVELVGLADILGPNPDATTGGPVVVEAFARYQKLTPQLSAMFMFVAELHRLKVAPNQLNASTWVHEDSITRAGDLQNAGQVFDGSPFKLLALVSNGATLHLNTIEQATAVQDKAARLDAESLARAEAAGFIDRDKAVAGHGFR